MDINEYIKENNKRLKNHNLLIIKKDELDAIAETKEGRFKVYFVMSVILILFILGIGFFYYISMNDKFKSTCNPTNVCGNYTSLVYVPKAPDCICPECPNIKCPTMVCDCSPRIITNLTS
jgi:uncharacterized membrane protein